MQAQERKERETGAGQAALRPDQVQSGDALARQIAQKSRARQISLASNPRALHRKLFRGSRPDAGLYRRAAPEAGRSGRVIMLGPRLGGNQLVKHGEAPERLKRRMAKFCILTRAALDYPPPYDLVPETIAILTERFLSLHPFSDGNGRVCRLMVRLWGDVMQRPLSAQWTVDKRPYGAGFFYALYACPQSLNPLNLYMQRYFDRTAP